MIDIKNLEENDKGRWVEYMDGAGKKEKGRIKGWNDLFIFVVYHCAGRWDQYWDYTGCATSPKDLHYTRIGG